MIITEPLIFRGEDSVLIPAMELIARSQGWTATVLNEEGQEISNPITAKEAVTILIKTILRDVAKSQATKEAQELAAQVAAAQVVQVLDAITIESGE